MVRILKIAVIFLQAGFLFLGLTELRADIKDISSKSVVRIDVNIFSYSYTDPWMPPSLSNASGTGFIIEGNRIITNAHVVSMANTIRVSRSNQRKDYIARVIYIAHDCDIAMLKVEDEEFFRNSAPLPIGDIPELNSPVVVIGFPIGGDRVSITRGIVSRKEMDLYTHSGVDSHLTIQVDAAINPGNSGGPALQDGKVIGIAFQVNRGGQNLGYLIPTIVINRFLDDVKDGKYDGYIEFGVITIPTVNPVLRSALDLSKFLTPPDTGVMLVDLLPGSSADGYLMPGDILTEIDGHAISHYGDIDMDGVQLSYTEIVDNLSAGIIIHTVVIRKGEMKKISFPARATAIMDFQKKNYDSPPRMKMEGGLVFQPLDSDLMDAYGNTWRGAGRTDIQYYYSYHVLHKLYEKKKEYVILTRRLSDPVNMYADRFVGRVVDSINGGNVTDFKSFNELLDRSLKNSEFITIRFLNESIPLVMKSEDVRNSHDRVLKNYTIRYNQDTSERVGAVN